VGAETQWWTSTQGHLSLLPGQGVPVQKWSSDVWLPSNWSVLLFWYYHWFLGLGWPFNQRVLVFYGPFLGIFSSHRFIF
jgi:hypothetical protein